MRPVLGHDRRDDPLGRALLEQRRGDLLDHPGLGPFAHPDQDGPVADRHARRPPSREERPKSCGLEAPVVTEVRVPVLELGVPEHRVVAVDRSDVVGLEPPRRPEHRVDRDAAVDPAGGVPREQGVRQGRQHEHALVVQRCSRQRARPVLPQVEPGLGHGEAADEVGGEDVGLHRGQGGPHLVHQGKPHGVLRGRHLDQAVPALVAGRERLGEERLEQEDLDATLLHPRDELVVLVLGALDPQDVVEEQGVVGGRRQPLETELRAVHHHLSQAPDL